MPGVSDAPAPAQPSLAQPGDRAIARPAPPPRIRARLTPVDLLLFAFAGGVVWYAAYRVNDVLVYDWNWRPVLNFVLRRDDVSGQWVPNLLLRGLFTTIRLAVWATIAASLIGGVMGYWRTRKNLTLRILSRGYVELIRNIPPVVFIFIFYFFISSQIFPALGLDRLDPSGRFAQSAAFRIMFGDPALFTNFLSGVICLSLLQGAYITEIVRAGIQAVPHSQWEAARAIGLSKRDVLRDVILPQALRKTLPPLAGQFITLVKDSSIVSLISIQELTYLATEVSATTSRVFETWILVGAMYFALCYSFAVLFGWLERRAARSRR